MIVYGDSKVIYDGKENVSVVYHFHEISKSEKGNLAHACGLLLMNLGYPEFTMLLHVSHNII